MTKSNIDLWARFLSNEKLVLSRMDPHWMMELVRLCEEAAKVQAPKYRPYRDRIDSREFICDLAMDLGIDLPAIKHKTKGKVLMGRGLLDAWNRVYAEKYESAYGTLSLREAKRRDVVSKLSKLPKEPPIVRGRPPEGWARGTNE